MPSTTRGGPRRLFCCARTAYPVPSISPAVLPLCDVFALRMWSLLADITRLAARVMLAHMFAHCEGPRGDIVDREAQVATKQPQGKLPSWHVDHVRRHLQKVREQDLASLIAARRDHAARCTADFMAVFPLSRHHTD
ncbi:uncharacterized protein Tco025E_08708 [Trypanosoma conorhini]|uniref:Uncharacterized protein n=1 Tax=Trypanosoma conorhini TaxID=83891 RepID=A0A3R7K6V2_9TRYP|nr:uncharacterized protein Tco025E_08708 [Trypanosoma conorhini]RNF00931.1 hypothetical protein Tco025E_08708 [Trypanosoma conorhini]